MIKYMLFFSFFLVVLSGNSQDLQQIRTQYPQAQESEEITSQLNESLSQISVNANPVLMAYKGGVKTLMADFAKKAKEKKEYFKEGVGMIESALKMDSENIEIRYIRLSVQENSPKFLKYHDNIAEDKEFILKHYSAISSKSIKAFIKDFVSESKSFDEAEKTSLD